MDVFGRLIFWTSTTGFLLACVAGFYFWVRLFAVRAQAKRFRIWEVSLWGKLCSTEPAARYARSFMRSMLVAAGFWCAGFATGLSTGILH